MTQWYVHRPDGPGTPIASAHAPSADGASPMPGYCDELVADSHPDYVIFAAPQRAAAVGTLRDARLAAGYADATFGKTFQTDDDSQGKITAIGASAGMAITMNTIPAPSYQFIAADNAIVPMTAPQAFAWSQRILAWVSATYLHARDLKNQILAGQAPDINAGWP